MSKDELIMDVELDLDALDSETARADVTDLKLKYLIFQELQRISAELHEISLYGIGTV